MNYVLYLCVLFMYIHSLYYVSYNTASGSLHDILCTAAVDFINHANSS